MAQFGVHDFAYPSIVGSSSNAAILHYMANDRKVREGELVLCDLGGQMNGLCADITTTFPTSGKFTQV